MRVSRLNRPVVGRERWKSETAVCDRSLLERPWEGGGEITDNINKD